MIHNPIIPGFAADPSILRVGEDYYLATSSFEWLPGVAIYHSKDLRHWKLEDYGLKTKEQIDMIGVKPSAGVWAPCLSYNEAEKRFYLMYSNVHCKNNWFFDVDNFIITAEDIHGPWSEPIYVNSCGFDYSLFHDTDGRKWIVGKDRDFRNKNIDKRAIILQEIDIANKCLIGKPVQITQGGTERRFVEAPHLYKHNGWYYLMVAEGGTGYGHSVVVLRSRKIDGPYECYEGNPIITSWPEDFSASENGTSFYMFDRYNPDSILQKSGHGSLVETQTGEWYVAHLCARPLMPEKLCPLGRETSIQKMMWTEDDRLVMADGSKLAKSDVPAPAIPEHKWEEEPIREDFDGDCVPLIFQAPRTPLTEDWITVKRTPGSLSLRGRESLTSNFFPSIAARRLTAFKARAEVCLDYKPESYHHRAGLTFYYDAADHHYIFKTYEDETDRELISVASMIGKKFIEYPEVVEVPKGAKVWLRGIFDGHDLQFFYSLDGENFAAIGPKLSTLNLTDEGGSYGRFTGTYVGMFAQDTQTKSKWADFEWFEYEAEEE